MARRRGREATNVPPIDGVRLPHQGDGHIHYDNKNSAFLKEALTREDYAHEAWRKGDAYVHPRKPTIEVGLLGRPTGAPYPSDPGAQPRKANNMNAIKRYEKELRVHILSERRARNAARAGCEGMARRATVPGDEAMLDVGTALTQPEPSLVEDTAQ